MCWILVLIWNSARPGTDLVILNANNLTEKAILELPEVKSRGLRKKFFDYRVCTIHKYCRSKNPGSDVWDGICDDHFENLCMENINFKELGDKISNTHKNYIINIQPIYSS